jgi:hypothetical protein
MASVYLSDAGPWEKQHGTVTDGVRKGSPRLVVRRRLRRHDARMTGHVFVVPGSLELLDCDDVVVPTDHAVDVTDLWDGVLEWTDDAARERDLATIRALSDRERVAQLPERGSRRRWLLSVGNGAGDVRVLIAGLDQCLRAVAASPPLGDRVVRRVAVPTLGVSRGGYGR